MVERCLRRATPTRPIPATYIHTRRPKAGKEAQFEQRISELILRSATFPGYLGTTSIEPDNLGNRRYVFRFADRESLERWFNSPERRDCLAQLDPLTDGIPSYEPVYGEQALWTQVRVPRANPHKQTLISWLATVVFAFAIGGIVSAMGAGSLVGLLVTTALVVVIKSYWVMPFLARKLSRWLNR
ncbi:antibiotic biosynthesis monooxygenase [Dendronalium sp. ChiSLP03b]|uniref:antibiotic biosynthesis monooxygenase n=1 Tax=Dendronalium sp. ChiSLP03b TaxID=3075381 RepID=UPI002AD4990A|nr:antibiotic biosynthesis monooxygenase [Dendronalium sp. ChiSLP03b]MDZ8208688.1 antibiotic biosynthesis monooxygenase [Dendronalium sp. ChiSLP03b]